MTIRLALLLAAVALCTGVCACGGASSASSEVLHAEELHAEVAATAAAANPITVSPLPYTEDASPATEIDFLGAPGTRASDVRVRGSRSGAHAGRLEAYATGTGESFLPAHPFLPGEQVTVHAHVRIGTGPVLAASTTFTVAHQAVISTKEFPIQPGNASEVQHYSSAPTLTPSAVTITTPAALSAAPGDLFLAPYQGQGTPGPMIAEQNGALVWFHPLPAGYESTNFHVQQYEGKPVLTWWQGRILEVGFGQGEEVLYNTAYQQVATIRAGNGYRSDLHEIRITPEGTAWIDVFDPVDMSLRAEGGSSHDILTDSVIEEVDIKTGLVMWEWHALGHIPVGESNQPVPANNYPWDYVHINSIDPDPTGQVGGAGSGQTGDVLLSSRNTWTLYDVDLHSGGFHWRIGGKRSTFKLGPGVKFYWQHDAEWEPGGLISVFDNGSNPAKEKQSRGLLLAPDLATRAVTLVKQFTNPAKTLLASSQGDLQNLSSSGQANGNWLMGYGGLPNFTEYGIAGEVLLDGTLGKDVQDFRTYLAPWSAQPTTPPSVVAQAGAAGALTVAASWNGATEVASWQVLAGASPSALTPVATAPKSGFQTTITAPSAGPYVAVQALNSAGAVIGTSPTVQA
jgi:Arylsulfotransferase (ASST)